MAFTLPREFYISKDLLIIAQGLLGKEIVCAGPEGTTAGLITETEAYAGITDKASHAYGGRFTQRTSTMFQAGGIAYVYLCYGLHHMFNVVAHAHGIPNAILIRAINPTQGEGLIGLRRKGTPRPQWCNGPGKLCQALGINLSHNGSRLDSASLQIRDLGLSVNPDQVCVGPRVGIDYAQEDRLLPYRFVWQQPSLP
ncbi:MAG: DNA-3-methyladenine glycosylase [Bacteroidetes bacterium]|jgi:DNA-3-methyladenine glycosylase|nr:DNA-3-methyladenine glycosylase [Bacteroidota bacterium]